MKSTLILICLALFVVAIQAVVENGDDSTNISAEQQLAEYKEMVLAYVDLYKLTQEKRYQDKLTEIRNKIQELEKKLPAK